MKLVDGLMQHALASRVARARGQVCFTPYLREFEAITHNYTCTDYNKEGRPQITIAKAAFFKLNKNFGNDIK